MEINLSKYGLTEEFKKAAAQDAQWELARVTEQHRNLYKIVTKSGFYQAQVSGKLHHESETSSDFPAVGDWVLVSKNTDQAVIHKKSNIRHKNRIKVSKINQKIYKFIMFLLTDTKL